MQDLEQTVEGVSAVALAVRLVAQFNDPLLTQQLPLLHAVARIVALISPSSRAAGCARFAGLAARPVVPGLAGCAQLHPAAPATAKTGALG